MARLPIINNLRVVPRDTDFLDRKLGLRGEIFYDNDKKTLRLYDAQTVGGMELVKEDLSNVTNAVFAAKALTAGVGGGGSGSIEVSDSAPTDPEEGTIWFDSSTARLYVYVNDGNSAQWIQPAVPASQSGGGGVSSWGDLQDKPTTLGGYGITDAVPKTGATITGAIDAPTVAAHGLRFLYPTISDFPDATTYHGAVAHSHADGALYFAHAGGWVELANKTILTTYATTTALNTATSNASNWDSAFGWGDHSVAGYLTTESDTLDTITGRGATTTNTITVGGLNTSTFSDTGIGATAINSSSAVTITTVDGARFAGGPVRLPSMDDTARNALTAVNGDIIYNTTSNKIEAYQNGGWIELDTGAAA
jgi:hypothetical protein